MLLNLLDLANPISNKGAVKTIMTSMIKEYEQSLAEMPINTFHLGE
jgi:hypothetical protein